MRDEFAGTARMSCAASAYWRDARRPRLLECFDSVRLTWSDVQAAPDSLGEVFGQLMLETLFTLSFGCDLVVPQPYALDSLGCLYVLSCLDEAHDRLRDERAAHEPLPAFPARLHLHNADSFRAAVGAMLRRMDSVTEPFHSSLLPELNRHPEGLATAAAEALETSGQIGRLLELLPRNESAVDDQRDRLLEAVWRRFGTAGARDARRVVRPHSVPSIGVASVASSTGLDDTDRAGDRLAARDLAYRCVAALSGGADLKGAGDGEIEELPYRLDIPADKHDRRGRDVLNRVMRERAVDALTAVLRARESPEWRQELTGLVAAQRAGDSTKYGEALESHATRMAAALAGVVEVRSDDRRRGLLLSARLAGVGALSAASTAVGYFSPVVAVSAGAALGVVSSGAEIYSHLSRRNTRKQLATALGRLLPAPALAGA
jgi:hypothetical protein